MVLRGRFLSWWNDLSGYFRERARPQKKSPSSDTARIVRLKTLSSFSVWCCMAVFSVSEVVCLVISVNERDLSLLNHVKYDSYLITSQRDRSRTHP